MVATRIWQRFALLGVLNRSFVADFRFGFGIFQHPPSVRMRRRPHGIVVAPCRVAMSSARHANKTV